MHCGIEEPPCYFAVIPGGSGHSVAHGLSRLSVTGVTPVRIVEVARLGHHLDAGSQADPELSKYIVGFGEQDTAVGGFAGETPQEEDFVKFVIRYKLPGIVVQQLHQFDDLWRGSDVLEAMHQAMFGRINRDAAKFIARRSARAMAVVRAVSFAILRNELKQHLNPNRISEHVIRAQLELAAFIPWREISRCQHDDAAAVWWELVRDKLENIVGIAV